MNAEETLKLKKRMMFIKGDDVYFIAYNILLLLADLNCNSNARPFKDYRKLSFLIDFISDPRLTAIVAESRSYNITPSSEDRHELSLAYSRGASRQHHVMRVICALETRDILSIERGTQNEGFDLYLRPGQIPENFLTDELYEVERQNTRTLRKLSPHLRTMRLDTMLQNLYGASGVEVWHA